MRRSYWSVWWLNNGGFKLNNYTILTLTLYFYFQVKSLRQAYPWHTTQYSIAQNLSTQVPKMVWKFLLHSLYNDRFCTIVFIWLCLVGGKVDFSACLCIDGPRNLGVSVVPLWTRTRAKSLILLLICTVHIHLSKYTMLSVDSRS